MRAGWRKGIGTHERAMGLGNMGDCNLLAGCLNRLRAFLLSRLSRQPLSFSGRGQNRRATIELGSFEDLCGFLSKFVHVLAQLHDRNDSLNLVLKGHNWAR